MGFLIAAAIIFLILILKISVRIILTDDLALKLGIGIFRIGILPAKEKTVRLSDYKIKNYRKIKEKERKKALKAEEKAKQKKDRKKVDKTAAKVEDARRRAAGEPKPKKDIMGLISAAIQLVKTLVSKFGHHLRIRVRRIRITVATDNAADTAVLYGAVCGGVQCIMELLYNTMHVKLPKNSEELSVVPDFTSDKLKAEVDIAFSFRVWQVFDMLIKSGIAFLKKYLDKDK